MARCLRLAPPLGETPVSRRVADAVAAFIADARDFARLHYPAWELRAESVRVAAAGLVHAAAEEVAFVASTSDGLSAVATGFDWKPGDSVVAVDGEFPANVYPWWALGRLGVRTRLAPIVDGRLTVEACRLRPRHPPLIVGHRRYRPSARNADQQQ